VIEHIRSATDWVGASDHIQSVPRPLDREADPTSVTPAGVDSADSWGSTFAVAGLVIALVLLGLIFS
jgi:hypothetical protein